MFGSTSTFNIETNSVNTMGEIAVITRKDGQQLMKTGALRVNGIRTTDPDEKVMMEKILIKGQFSIICWGKRKFSLIKWF